jgi:hypothetical protein
MAFSLGWHRAADQEYWLLLSGGMNDILCQVFSGLEAKVISLHGKLLEILNAQDLWDRN